MKNLKTTIDSNPTGFVSSNAFISSHFVPESPPLWSCDSLFYLAFIKECNRLTVNVVGSGWKWSKAMLDKKHQSTLDKISDCMCLRKQPPILQYKYKLSLTHFSSHAKKITCYYCTILYNTVILYYINTVVGVSFNQLRCYLTPSALSLFLFFLFLLQRTVFPKDYHVVHHYRTSMFCDDDPVSSLPDQSS